MIVAEGNIFQNVNTPLLSPVEGRIFTSPSTSANTACKPYLGHNCMLNQLGSSGPFVHTDTGFFSNFEGKNIASAEEITESGVVANAGIGKI